MERSTCNSRYLCEGKPSNREEVRRMESAEHYLLKAIAVSLLLLLSLLLIPCPSKAQTFDNVGFKKNVPAKVGYGAEGGVTRIDHEKLTVIEWLDGIVVKVRPNRYQWRNVLDQSIIVTKDKKVLYQYKQTWIGEYFRVDNFPYFGCKALIIRTSDLGTQVPDAFVSLVKFPTGKHMAYLIDWIWSKNSAELISDVNNDGSKEVKLTFGYWTSCADIRLSYQRLLVFDKASESWRLDRIGEFPQFYRAQIETAETEVRQYSIKCKPEGEECGPEDFFAAVFDLAYCRFFAGESIGKIKENLLKRYAKTEEEKECVQSMIEEVESRANEDRWKIKAKGL
jgi:hypothetical protein